ncbi:hypothetical protein BS47DRAFT_493189 [Hydnum rufescens UP504]|uniref:Uncharacterized protein n=1 Tax=Hydnum rufescens UP504 TaxID=1448309 RepID=A0A9P6DPP5_9AGAM|nr:hypothetical protein BS47DRAFT_493189 [Hydnum rufescens UP504]
MLLLLAEVIKNLSRKLSLRLRNHRHLKHSGLPEMTPKAIQHACPGVNQAADSAGPFPRYIYQHRGDVLSLRSLAFFGSGSIAVGGRIATVPAIFHHDSDGLVTPPLKRRARNAPISKETRCFCQHELRKTSNFSDAELFLGLCMFIGSGDHCGLGVHRKIIIGAAAQAPSRPQLRMQGSQPTFEGYPHNG